jgi:5-methylcytosine-specific restriction endonuclease McrA
MKICTFCDKEIVTDKRISPMRKDPYKGQYACSDCMKIRVREIRTQWMKDVLNGEKAEYYKEMRNKAKEAFNERNPEIAKARAFMSSVYRRIKVYGGDTNKFKNIHARKFAEVLMRLPCECQKCKSKEDLTVEHVTPLIEDWTLALEESNLTTLCRSCNTREYHGNP